MTTTAENLGPRSDPWHNEVQSVLAATPELAPAARTAVLAVLASFAREDDLDERILGDIETLQAALAGTRSAERRPRRARVRLVGVTG
jgi:hypothetical protein